MKSLIAIACVAAGLSGCATPVLTSCASGERSAEIVRLFFGRNVGHTPAVSEREWERFVDRELVPRFPEGLSVIDTAGVGRSDDGAAVHELGKAVVIVLSGKDEEAGRIVEVTSAYKAKFSQESILTARSRACVAS